MIISRPQTIVKVPQFLYDKKWKSVKKVKKSVVDQILSFYGGYPKDDDDEDSKKSDSDSSDSNIDEEKQFKSKKRKIIEEIIEEKDDE